MQQDHKIPAWQEGYSIRDFDTSRDRTFLIPVSSLGKKLIVAALLISPGLFSIVYYQDLMPQFPKVLTVFLMILTIWGIISSFFVNRIKLRADGIEIRKDFRIYFILYSDIENVILLDQQKDYLEPKSSQGHLPLELADKSKKVIIVALKADSEVECDRDGFLKAPVSWVSLNVYRSRSLINSIRMRR